MAIGGMGFGSSDILAITQMQVQDQNMQALFGGQTGNATIANSCNAQLGGLLGVPSVGVPSTGGIGGLMGMMNPLTALGQFFSSQSMPMQLGGFASLPPVGMNIGLGMSLAGAGLGGVSSLVGLFGSLGGFGGISFGGTGGTGGVSTDTLKPPRTSESILFLGMTAANFAKKEYDAKINLGGFMGPRPTKVKLFADDNTSPVVAGRFSCIKGEEEQTKFTSDMSQSLLMKLKYEERRDYKQFTAEAFAESYTNYLKSKNPNLDVERMKKALTRALTDPNFGQTQKTGFGRPIYGYGSDPDVRYLQQNGINDVEHFKQYVDDVSGQIKDQVAKDNMMFGK